MQYIHDFKISIKTYCENNIHNDYPEFNICPMCKAHVNLEKKDFTNVMLLLYIIYIKLKLEDIIALAVRKLYLFYLLSFCHVISIHLRLLWSV